MKVGIIGNYGATNIGDEAILNSILKNLSGHQLTVFKAHPQHWEGDSDIQVVSLFPLGFRSFLKHGLRKSLRALKGLDVVILGGGGLFQDNYLYACFLWAWQVFWVKYCKKPLFIYASGVGPLNTWWGKRLTKWAYEKADVITVRDDYSHHLLRSIDVEKEILVTADPVFCYDLDQSLPLRTKNLVCRQAGLFIISIRPWLNFKHQILEAFGEFLEDLERERGAKFIFVCMQNIEESDLEMIKPLMKRVGGELCVIRNFSELIELMKKADFAIGMRYHFMIAAILALTPLIPVSYAPKTESLFHDTELEKFLIKFDDLTAYKLKNTFKAIDKDIQNSVHSMDHLRNKMYHQSEQNNIILKEFLSSLAEKIRLKS